MNIRATSTRRFGRGVRAPNPCYAFVLLCTMIAGCGGGGSGGETPRDDETAASTPAPSTPPSSAGSSGQSYLPVSIANLNYPLNFLQVFGPTPDDMPQTLVGRVGAMWSSGSGPQAGVYSMSYAPAYRLDTVPAGWSGASGYDATPLDWLYYTHPDWIEYGADGNVMYEFGITDYPVVDISNPNVQQYMAQAMVAKASGYQALSLDNVSTQNIRNESTHQAGHYTGTTVPCPASLRPKCGGTFVAQYASDSDSRWTAANLAYLKYISAQAKAAGFATIANLSYEGGPDFVAAANAVSGILVENVPQQQGVSAANSWYNGFIIDDLFTANLYNAANVTQKFYAAVSYLNGHDTNSITMAEESYATAWTLLTTQGVQSFLGAAKSSSRVVEPYPPSMGGYVDVTVTGASSAGSTTVTGLSSSRSVAAGLRVTGAGIPANTVVAAVSGTTLTLSAPATASAATVTLNISGLPTLPIGKPVAPPPAVNPYAAPPTGVCGWINGANAGVCSRRYSNGWVYMNPVCQYNGTNCSVAAQVVTIPSSGSGRWYDQFCNVVPAGRHTMNAATALVIAQGTATQCPWPQP
jgi:hypothetical protein